MEGCCVEIHSLSRQIGWNGRRGVIVGGKGERRTVRIDDGPELSIKAQNLCQVFCIGLPCETRVIVDHKKHDRDGFKAALQQTDCTKFYVMHMGGHDGKQYYIRIRFSFFEIALKKIAVLDREPLVRFYITEYSQNDPTASILFGDSMRGCVPSHCFVDLTSEKMMKLVGMMSSITGDDSHALNLSYELDLQTDRPAAT